MTAIDVSNVSKMYKLYNTPKDRLVEAIFPFFGVKYREFFALSDITFQISQGETVGIIGKNGSGKSTLLKILTGVLTQTCGKVDVKGRVSALLELGAGFNPEYTGIENIYLNGAIMGFSKEQMKEKIPQILEFADIGDFVYQAVKTYSSGMFVRLAFAVAINVEPDILIVDEALAVGDYRFQAKCYKKFEELKNKNKTILFVTHDVDAVRRFCTRTVWVNNGSVVMDGKVSDVTAKYMEFITGSGKLPSEDISKIKQNSKSTLEPQKFNAINRFGSHLGAIQRVMLSKQGNETRVFDLGDKIEVNTVVDIPEAADLSSVSVAIAVKNKAGLDLLVTSTFDEGLRFNEHGRHEVCMVFDNYLNAGEYSIVCALENRETLPITYFDYIEGAEYFKTMTDKEYYGVISLPVKVDGDGLMPR